MTNSVVLATDVGYGHVKSVLLCPDTAGPVRLMFPALNRPSRVAASEGTARPDLVEVQINGRTYTVGRDIHSFLRRSAPGRTLTDDYPTRDEYLAYVCGALAYANRPEIDQLVLGLPMHTYETHHEALRERCSGRHHVAGRDFLVKGVTVMQQAVGALIELIATEVLVSTDLNAYIDFGHKSTDWVVARGTKINDERSSGEPIGASTVYRAIASAIERDFRQPGFDDLERIEVAVRTGTPMRIHEERFDVLQRYADEIAPVAAPLMQQVMATIGDGSDLDRLVIGGGAAPLFLSAVQSAYPKRRVTVAPDAQFLNPCGFARIGRRLARR